MDDKMFLILIIVILNSDHEKLHWITDFKIIKVS